ncbi:hypothetical protein W97_03482 [Coniosporium apollinis CBS 100218]|uniref:Glucose N-acetyltransferase 1 n=1 Tax=Coniosporium apollinis (strain CBS 100218) TaxID=1168221 RepID=R7YRH5_CONA1|nr:uncharacterized protein W97_03482 [Coniosporium apollinis CBS 100218]EON64251.1 hypothetical protein W97_03482 [Coniosporium apollinis CBS 100218]
MSLLRGNRNVILLLAIIIVLLLFHSGNSSSSSGAPFFHHEAVDWSRYAYSQYATDSAYLCNSVMVFEALHRLGSRAGRILFYPKEWDTVVSSSKDRDSQLLVMARDKYKVKLIPTDIPSIKISTNETSTSTWTHSIGKFLAFSQMQYTRILHLDSDITLLKSLDDLFFLPSAPVAMPRAYWMDTNPKPLTSLLVLLEPSQYESNALMSAAAALAPRPGARAAAGEAGAAAAAPAAKYDMELLNDRYAPSALVLPHRPLFLLTGEFRLPRASHSAYLGPSPSSPTSPSSVSWDPDQALSSASLVHFSDWPLPKPWIMWPQGQLAEMVPRCWEKPGTAEEKGCRDREVWLGLYADFRKRRKEVCRLLSVPAPEWAPSERGAGGGV